MKYATCAADCGAAASWKTVAADTFADMGEFTSIAVDRFGRVHASYLSEGQGNLKYATCAKQCEEAASWRAAIVDATPGVGMSTSLALEDNGRVHVAYYDSNGGDLKYIR